MKDLNSIMKSSTPLNEMYKMIPEKKKKSFLRFAKMFGYSEDKIKEALSNEAKKSLKTSS